MTSASRPTIASGVAALALAVILAGCTPTPAPGETAAVPTPVATPSATPTPSPTPTPTQAPETGETMPARVFGGDCDAAFATDDLRDMLDAKVSLDQSDIDDAIEVTQSGGIGCVWRTGDYSTLVNVDLLPQATIVSTEETATCTRDDEEGPAFWRCEVEHQSAGIRLSGFFSVRGSVSKKRVNEALDSFVSQFDANATPEQAAPAPIPAADAWTNPVDCESLGEGVDLKSVFNDTPGFIQFDSGIDALPSPARIELWGGGGAGWACSWATNRTLTKKQLVSGMVMSFGVGIYGGAAWLHNEIDGGTDVSIEGADRVIRVKQSTEYETVYRYYVVDGPNLLTYQSGSNRLGNDSEAITLVLDYLDSH